MTAAELLAGLIEANLAAAAAIVLVLALRAPARKSFGARLAYGLWLLVPLAAAATLIPARIVAVELPATASEGGGAVTAPTGLDLTGPALWLWIAGALGLAGFFAWRQRRFLKEAAEGVVGPAVVGVIAPRIVLPSDFADRFAPEEQDIVLAHERAHLSSHDARINAAVAAAQCLCWFNPLMHVAANALRTDQELACDAVVLARHPTARRAYAEALIKTQLAATPLPLGCYWPAKSEHPLTERIAMLKLAAPTRSMRLAGAAATALLCLGGGLSAWAAQPARVIVTPRPVEGAQAARAAAAQALRREPRVVARVAVQPGESRSQGLERAREALRADPELTEEQRQKAIEAIDRARTAIEAQRPQIEAARAAIEAQRGTIAAQIAQLAQDQRRIVIPQVQRLETRELTPEERAALDKARGELSAAQAKMREAQKALSEASAEMAKAQSEVLKHQLRPGCFGAEADGRCKLLFAPGAALTPDGAGLAFLKPGQPFRFPEGWPADKLTVRPFDGELLKKMRPFPEGLDFKCDQSDAGVLRCRPEPRGEKKPD